jgi:ABC-type uncharacterized transport system permease subunit
VNELLSQVLTAAFLQSALALASPLGFAALGGIICERAGVINLALEGMLLAAAFGSAWAAVETGNLLLALLFGIACSGLVGLVHAFLSVTVRMSQIISGIAMNLLALGLTGFLSRLAFPSQPAIEPMRDFAVPILSDVPVLGESLFDQTLLFYALVPLGILLSLFLFRTRPGLALRTTGESARVASTSGLSPVRIRYAAVVVSGLIAGLGGVFLALAENGTFTENMTNGKGFIAFAVVIFSGWRPGPALAAAFLFGAIEALAFRVQIINPSIPFQFVLMLPHLVTVTVFVLLQSRVRAPDDLGRPLAA